MLFCEQIMRDWTRQYNYLNVSVLTFNFKIKTNVAISSEFKIISSEVLITLNANFRQSQYVFVRWSSNIIMLQTDYRIQPIPHHNFNTFCVLTTSQDSKSLRIC